MRRASWSAARAGRRCGRCSRSPGASARRRTLVTLIPDSGRGYLSKLYDDNWLMEHGLLEREAPAPTIEEVLAFKRQEEPEIPELVTVESHQKVGEAIDLMQRYSHLADPRRAARRRRVARRRRRLHPRARPPRPGLPQPRGSRRGGGGRHGAASACGRDRRVRRHRLRRPLGRQPGGRRGTQRQAGGRPHPRRPPRVPRTRPQPRASAPSDVHCGRGFRDARHPRRARARPGHRGGDPADLPDVDVRPGRRRRQQGLRLLARPETRRGRLSRPASPRSKAPTTGSRTPPASARRRRSCTSSTRATASSP